MMGSIKLMRGPIKLMRGPINQAVNEDKQTGHQGDGEAIRGNWRQLEVIRGNRRQSEANQLGHQGRGERRLRREAIEAIRGD
jgi:hypothetical protein